jgi:peptidylprolyl isomerase
MLLPLTFHSSPAEWRGDKARIKPPIRERKHPMDVVRSGDTVSVHYTGKLSDGTVFDSSEGSEPLVFTVGEGMVIEGFEKALVGMKLGDSREVVIAPTEGYGERIEELVQTINRAEFSLGEMEPELGMAIEMQTPEGTIPLTITELTESSVTLDANHPLAGETLHFSLTLIQIGG